MAVGGISRDGDGRAWVLDVGGFAASTRDGGASWVPSLLFSPVDPEDEFRLMTLEEAETMFNAARSSLSDEPVRERKLENAASYLA